MMRKLLIVLVFLLFATTAIAGDTFQSQEQVGSWLMNYYQKPDPSKVPDAVEYMSKAKVLDNNAIPAIFGFLAGVFQDNPKKVADWVERLSSLEESHLGVLVLGLWYANLPDSQKRVYAILDAHPNLKKNFQFLYQGTPMSVEHIPLEQGPWVIDVLWGNFMATGSKVPVLRIASALPWIDVKGDINRLLVGGSARWSLTSNAEQHKRVLEICEAEVGTQPKEVGEKLRELIINAKKEINSDQNK